MWRPSGRLSWRRLANLVNRLPGESQTVTAIRNSLTDAQLAEMAANADASTGAWSRAELILSDIEHAARLLLWQNGGGKGKQPEPMSRPGSKASQPAKPVSPAGLAYLERLRARREG